SRYADRRREPGHPTRRGDDAEPLRRDAWRTAARHGGGGRRARRRGHPGRRPHRRRQPARRHPSRRRGPPHTGRRDRQASGSGGASMTPRPAPGAERVVAVLNFLTAHPDESFTLSELARRLDLNKATCHALLMTLTDAGYLLR